jgi:hypothetical protein
MTSKMRAVLGSLDAALGAGMLALYVRHDVGPFFFAVGIFTVAIGLYLLWKAAQ